MDYMSWQSVPEKDISTTSGHSVDRLKSVRHHRLLYGECISVSVKNSHQLQMFFRFKIRLDSTLSQSEVIPFSYSLKHHCVLSIVQHIIG